MVSGEEIWAQTNGCIDAFVSGAGTGGTVAGVSSVLKSRDPRIQVYLSDPPGSSLYNKVSLKNNQTKTQAETDWSSRIVALSSLSGCLTTNGTRMWHNE